LSPTLFLSRIHIKRVFLPLLSFEVDDIEKDPEKLSKLCVVFKTESTKAGTVIIAF
jgi:hypothetical protein